MSAELLIPGLNVMDFSAVPGKNGPRNSQHVAFVLEDKKGKLESRQQELKSIKGQVTRKRNELKKLNDQIHDPRNRFWRTHQYNRDNKLQPKLREIENHQKQLPGLIEEAKKEVAMLEKELEEAHEKEREEAEKRAAHEEKKKAEAATAPATRPTPVQNAAPPVKYGFLGLPIEDRPHKKDVAKKPIIHKRTFTTKRIVTKKVWELPAEDPRRQVWENKQKSNNKALVQEGEERDAQTSSKRNAEEFEETPARKRKADESEEDTPAKKLKSDLSGDEAPPKRRLHPATRASKKELEKQRDETIAKAKEAKSNSTGMTGGADTTSFPTDDNSANKTFSAPVAPMYPTPQKGSTNGNGNKRKREQDISTLGLVDEDDTPKTRPALEPTKPRTAREPWSRRSGIDVNGKGVARPTGRFVANKLRIEDHDGDDDGAPPSSKRLKHDGGEHLEDSKDGEGSSPSNRTTKSSETLEKSEAEKVEHDQPLESSNSSDGPAQPSNVPDSGDKSNEMQQAGAETKSGAQDTPSISDIANKGASPAKQAETGQQADSSETVGSNSPQSETKEQQQPEGAAVGNEDAGTPSTTESQDSKATGSSKEGTDASSQEDGTKEKAQAPPRHLNGLVNHRLACFSNVVIQLLDAGLDGHDIEAVLGEIDEDLERFGMSDKDCRKFDSGSLSSKPLKQQFALRAAIKKAASVQEIDSVSVAKHLRALLADLRTEYGGAEKQHVSPYLFQSVFAYGGADDAGRQRLNGDTQEDAFETYQAVLNTLVEDPFTADGNTLRALFEVETETRDRCMRLDCKHQTEPRKAKSNYHDITVPMKENDEHGNLSSLFQASLSSQKDEKCPMCNKGTLQAKTEFTKVGDNLVLKMNRTGYDQQTGTAYKIGTIVDYDQHNFTIKGDKYALDAVVLHRGKKLTRGHYTLYRKHQGSWYYLDDKRSDEVPSADKVVESHKSGECAMLLLKKVVE